jgi:hypothetical protein
MKRKFNVVLTIETNDNDDCEKDVSKHFKCNNTFQINDTCAKITKCKIS